MINSPPTLPGVKRPHVGIIEENGKSEVHATLRHTLMPHNEPIKEAIGVCCVACLNRNPKQTQEITQVILK